MVVSLSFTADTVTPIGYAYPVGVCPVALMKIVGRFPSVFDAREISYLCSCDPCAFFAFPYERRLHGGLCIALGEQALLSQQLRGV
jgi:hypothetical protein